MCEGNEQIIMHDDILFTKIIYILGGTNIEFRIISLPPFKASISGVPKEGERNEQNID